jgi:hypothetical protein
MIFCLHLLDHAHQGELRQRLRPEHKAYLGRVAERIAFAGPLLADDGQAMLGSLLMMNFDSRADALAWLAQEPFHRHGLYAQAQVHAFDNLWHQRCGFAPA